MPGRLVSGGIGRQQPRPRPGNAERRFHSACRCVGIGPPDPRFGVNATNLTPPELTELPKILPLLAVGREDPVWSAQGGLAERGFAGV